MTTNYIKRYSENLNIKNNITNFNEILASVEGISAVSWEFLGHSRREFGEKILKDMYGIINNDNINVMVQLSPEQPDTAMVNYKKTWGIIGDSGVNLDNITEKKSFIDMGRNGLILTGVGSIPITVEGNIQKLINSERELFFSNISPCFDFDSSLNIGRLNQWIRNILINNGIVFYLLGYFDEVDSEVVALGRKDALIEIM